MLYETTDRPFSWTLELVSECVGMRVFEKGEEDREDCLVMRAEDFLRYRYNGETKVVACKFFHF